VASFKENIGTAQLLLDNGADVEITDKDDDTPLSFAEYNKNEEMIKLLSQKQGRKK
jgi:ankyrin repeat protein